MRNGEKYLLSAALLTSLVMCQDAWAVNWLMLQGTEPPDAANPVTVWGFLQVDYQKDYSHPNASGGYIPPKLLAPDLTTQDAFNVSRARIGARGVGFPLDDKINYFFLAEFGNNGITSPQGGSARITDASITLNHIRGARIRAGLFKTPGPEEGLQAIQVLTYINFTTVTNQLMLERFPNSHYTANVAPITLPADTSQGGLNGFDKSVGAFRDTGVQVFDSFRTGNWEHTYAFMIGNGNGLNSTDVDSRKDTYLYWSSERIFEGKFNGLKLFIWNQRGKRLLDATNDGIYNPRVHDRLRSGGGFTFFRDSVRFSGEYMQGKGMIFLGPDKPTFDQNNSAPGADGADGKGSGWYLEGGYRLPNSAWELDLRYDIYHRLENDTGAPTGPNAGKGFESVWTTWTPGAQYFFNPKTRLTLNYAFRDVTSPDWAAKAGPNAEMDGIGNIAAVQLTHIF